MKIKPHSNRKLLRHEPLEDRHLLAVDMSGGMSGGMSSALFPQGEFAASQVATEIAANVEDTALIPADVIEQEEGATLQAEIAPVFFGPVTWRETEQYVTVMAGLSGVGVSPDFDLGTVMVHAAEPPLETFRLIVAPQYGYGARDGGSAMVFQTNGTEIVNGASKLVRTASVMTDVIDGPQAVITIDGRGSEYWTCAILGATEYSWTYTIPDDVVNKDVPRDFTFTATRGGKSASIPVHVAYAEISIQFAGEGDFVERTAVGGQTVKNTVVVGQKVHAIVETSDKITVDPGSIIWSHDFGGYVVRDYIANNNEGRIVNLWDAYIYSEEHSGYFAEELEIYYTSSNPFKIGGVSASFEITDVNGKIYDKNASALYYVDVPVVDEFFSQFAGEIVQNGEPTIGIRPDQNGIPSLTLGMIVDPAIRQDPIGGINWKANVTPTSYAGGEIAFVQLVDTYGQVNLADQTQIVLRSKGQYYLDGSFPYGDVVSVDSTLLGNDSPRIRLEDPEKEHNIISVVTNGLFKTYLIYQPSGADCICVSLSMLTWSWGGSAEKQPDGTWELVTCLCHYSASPSFNTNDLPTWSGRAQGIQEEIY